MRRDLRGSGSAASGTFADALDAIAVRGSLLEWYDRERRDLPWRAGAGEAPDPYHVWLSEVMLQQTRVETVRPYYRRWLERFPTLEALARASLDEVLKAWEGLGYYSRARNLHRAVREVADRYGGEVPPDPATFRTLPGVGRYTAGAVMSIAFGLEEPVVDGNVRRVLARLVDRADPNDRELWGMAARLVSGERPGDLNQALMELGATLCTPRSPACGKCPVRAHCAARASGMQELRPTRRRRAPLPHEDTAVALVERRGTVLLGRRAAGARLGGMWELPATIRTGDETLEGAAERAARVTTGLRVRAVEPLGSVEHVFSHVRVTYGVVRCELLSGTAAPLGYDEVVWAGAARRGQLALPRAQQRILELALGAGSNG